MEKQLLYKQTHRRFTLEPMAVCTDTAAPNFFRSKIFDDLRRLNVSKILL